jgi:hypothetical protein
MMSINNLKIPAETSGFTALVAVLLLSCGTMAISVSVMGAAATYADSVRSREVRIQNELNSQACEDTAELIRSKNVFHRGPLYLKEFGCTVFI